MSHPTVLVGGDPSGATRLSSWSTHLSFSFVSSEAETGTLASVAMAKVRATTIWVILLCLVLAGRMGGARFFVPVRDARQHCGTLAATRMARMEPGLNLS
jgi:hypothetical protein